MTATHCCGPELHHADDGATGVRSASMLRHLRIEWLSCHCENEECFPIIGFTSGDTNSSTTTLARGGSEHFATIGIHMEINEALLAARGPEQNEEEFLNGLSEEVVFALLNGPNLNMALARRVWSSMLESRCRPKLTTHRDEPPRMSNRNA